MTRRAAAWSAALGLALGAADPARGADDATALRLRAEQLASAGDCERAIELARRARGLLPTDARAALVEGRCSFQLQRYDAALAPLELALHLDPDLDEAALVLALSRYHLGQRERAEADFARLAPRMPDRAEMHLYRGLLLLDRGEGAAAAESLERARRLDPDAVEPMASYYAGRAWQSVAEREKAEQALRRAIELAPGSTWAAEAERALAARPAAPRRAWLRLFGGVEYDSNVVLRGEGVLLPSDISSEDDGRGVWSVEAGVELFRNEDWSAGAIAGYDGSAHFDLHDFDLQYPTGSVWLDRRLGPSTFARAQGDGGYAWYDGDSYLATWAGTLSLHQGFGDAGSGRAFARYESENYLFDRFDVPDGPGTPGDACGMGLPFCGPPGVDEARERNRDGQGLRVGYDHVLPLGGDVVLRAGVAFRRFWARGSEYTHSTWGGYAGARVGLPFGFAGDVEGGYTHARYRNPSTFPDGVDLGVQYALDDDPRRDHIFRVQTILERPVTEHVTLSARWRYAHHDSNAAVFDYDRHIAGGYVTIHFAR